MHAFFRQIAPGDRSSGGAENTTRIKHNPCLPNKAENRAGYEENSFSITFFFFFEGTFHLLKLPSYHLKVGSHK